MKFQPIVFFVGFFWTLSILYCLRWHYKEGNIKIPTIILSVFFGPILFLILIDNNIEIQEYLGIFFPEKHLPIIENSKKIFKKIKILNKFIRIQKLIIIIY